MADIPDVLKTDVSSVTAWIVAAGGGILLGLVKLRSMLSSEKTSTAGSDASGGVIEMLRVEVNRLAEQNTRLATMVNDLQLQVIALRTENSELRTLILKDSNVQQYSKAADKRS